MLSFEVDALQVLGLGGTPALEQKKLKEQIEIKEAMKRRQVDRKKAFLGDDDDDGATDMWLLETAGAHTSYVKDQDHVS